MFGDGTGNQQYLFIFSQVHLGFRLAEFESICSLFNIAYDRSSLETKKHVLVVELASDHCVQQILSRSMLVHSALKLFSCAANYDDLSSDLREKSTYLKKIVSVLPLEEAPVDLKNPCNVFTIVEELTGEVSKQKFQAVYFGKLIGYGQSKLKSRYNLTDRCYIGNTTMDPELSFIQANLVKANRGAFTLDPFCGTGGLLLAAAHFGAYVFGTEINYQIARACGKSSRVGAKYLGPHESVAGNFSQYNLDEHFVSLLIADASRHELWHLPKSGLFDSIVADPPYGIREKGSKVGNKERKAHWTLPGATHATHFPEKARYKISSVFLDLVNLAANVLVVNGRLSFWFPVFDEEYSEKVLPKHEALKLVADCKQPLAGRYSRHLLVYEKTRIPVEAEKAYFEADCYRETTFRERVFSKNTY
ncbi:unnamed protein product [Enterobius vermicularis]|uniref:tRNA (guanine(10)-N(2))-methyltransferase TRMT11 n=1 Tax=Enterobius vermicularis TaxID=51028 RepID=A0A0N4V430_ENTVE|nr:unnamed protein product [Enterobius vermicularis]